MTEDNWEEARIEQIGTGQQSDQLMISNRKDNLWAFSLFNDYEQLGTYDVDNPHTFREGQNILVRREKVTKKFLGIIPIKILDVVEVKEDLVQEAN